MQTAAFFHAVVAVLLAVFPPFVAAQKHAPVQNARVPCSCIEGRSALQAMAKVFCSAESGYPPDRRDFSRILTLAAKVGLSPGSCRHPQPDPVAAAIAGPSRQN